MPNVPETSQNQTSAPVQAGEPSKIEIRDRITRETVRAEKDKIFLFGDNLRELGLGGQAKEMRGEENAVGIPTKKAPSNNPNSFFTDKEFAINKQAIDEAFGKIPPGKIIVIPKAGLGTGLARLEEKAPQTFAYLNEKLARIGFSNPNKETSKDLTLKSSGENKVIVQSEVNEPPSAKRLLDLNNIQTASLKILSPTEKEIDALKVDSEKALADYADRLRQGYKNNTDNFRDGLRILSDSLEKGEQIAIACACRGSGAICHADVVKMAVEKVGAHIKNGQESEKGRNDILESRSSALSNSVKQSKVVSPRTQRAINEILSHSENDRILEKINDSDGRNRSEQASYLGRSSQFARDIYERGGQLVDGNLIVPQEKLTLPEPLAITTQDYAVSRIGKILHNESKAKELAPVVVEYGNKIAGLTADGETKLKVFGWMYDSLEGKSETSERDEINSFEEKPKFDETLEKIRVLAEEMRSLEPLDKIEFVPLAEFEQSYKGESVFDDRGENLKLEEIYEEAISQQENEKQFHSIDEKGEQFLDLEPDGKTNTEGYERIELANTPRIPEDFTKAENTRFITEILPEIDRQIERGTSPKEIRAPFAQAVSRSAKEDAQNRLDSIYRKQLSNKDKPKQLGEIRNSNQNLDQQLAKIDLRRQNIIELKSPLEYLSAEKEAINTFYRRQTVEVGRLLTKIDEVRQHKSKGGEKNQEIALKEELNQIKEAKPNFAFKLENSAEIVVGKPSEQSVQTRNFVSSYINYQLKQPETRLRFENERYRIYAARLESAATRDEVMKSASEIRAENAALGLKWKDLEMSEKAKRARPLTGKEMQFLFTESSPAHYTGSMTAARLSYAHSGASRRQMTESLLKGEISPSPEAHKLIESLQSRLQRREIKDSLSATRHFFESIKSPEKELKYKNSFDHREIYQKLPPQEKDFVYRRATEQKENLEYRLVFKKQQLDKGVEIGRIEKGKSQTSQAEKSYHLNSWFNQARILGDKVEQPALAQKEISERDCTAIAVLLNNHPIEKLENIAAEFQKSENPKNKKIGEVVQTFARAEIYQSENKTVVSLKLPKSKLVGVETYRELLEKFYPDDARENEKYKFEKFGEKEVFGALQKGQDEAINNLREEIKNNSYQTGAPANISEVEESVLEKLDKIAQLQTEARRALRENKSILGKYVARAGAQIQNQKAEIPSPNNQKEIVNLALGGKSSNPASNKIHDQFLQAAQKEITISDFQKFSANESFLDELKANIKSEFAEISDGLKVMEESKLHTSRTLESTEKEQNISANTANRELVENKPFTLRLFEKELEKAEKDILGVNLKEKLSTGIDLEKENNLNPASLFSNEERAAIKAQAFEVVKERLEPKELNADNRGLSPEASRQAFATYKQLERASNLFQTSDDKSKITEAFSKLDREAFQLNQIRQDYNRDEKMALLRDGIKSDLVDWYKKSSETKQASMEGQINKILTNNLKQFDFKKFPGDREQISVLSRQIVEKIETKQILAVKDKGMSADSRENVNPSKNHHSFRNETGKTNLLEKVKEAPVFTR
jgi:hypothetical protein